MRAVATILLTKILATMPALRAIAVAPHVNVAPPGARQTVVVLVQMPLHVFASHVRQGEGTIANTVTKIDIAGNGMLFSTIGQSRMAKLIVVVASFFEIAIVSIVLSLGVSSAACFRTNQDGAQEKESDQGQCKATHGAREGSAAPCQWWRVKEQKERTRNGLKHTFQVSVTRLQANRLNGAVVK
jgi:hypothetical protein